MACLQASVEEVKLAQMCVYLYVIGLPTSYARRIRKPPKIRDSCTHHRHTLLSLHSLICRRRDKILSLPCMTNQENEYPS